jgi:UDP-N-acetylglucosamine--N-acetylmuramyl-(pentapeptide) pyrophosphoryl-undecaprenol N-acetylglucosamine transferase
VVSAGGGVLVADADLTAEYVRSTVPALLGNPSQLAQMSAAAAAFGRRDADQRLAEMVRTAGGQA